MVGHEAHGKSHHVGTKDTKLGGSSHKHKLGVSKQRREVGHRTNAQEDERGIPALAYTLIEDVEHRALLIDTNLIAWLERNISNQDTETYWHKQHGLEVMLYRKIDKEQTHTEHDQALGRQRNVVEAGEVPELFEVFSNI